MLADIDEFLFDGRDRIDEIEHAALADVSTSGPPQYRLTLTRADGASWSWLSRLWIRESVHIDCTGAKGSVSGDWSLLTYDGISAVFAPLGDTASLP